METIYQLVKIDYTHDNRQDKEERDSSATQLVINETKEIHSSLNGVKVESVTREACNPLIGEMIERQFTFAEIADVMGAVTFTRKKRPVDCIKVTWRGTGTDRYFTEAQFRLILNS